MDTLNTARDQVKRSLLILAVGAIAIGGLLSMASTGIGMAKPARTTTTVLFEDSPEWDCGRHGNRVCGSKVAALESARAQEKATGNVCSLTHIDGDNPPWGWRVTCMDTTAYAPPVPVQAAPRVTG